MKNEEVIYRVTRSLLTGQILQKFPHDAKKQLAALLKNVAIGRKAVRWSFEAEQLAEADICLISFPKCGRTWLRLMIGRALEHHFGLRQANILELYQLAKLHPEIPKILVTHDDIPRKRPDELATSKTRYKHAKVVLLVRDPRDVIVSLYFHTKKRMKLYHDELTAFLFEEAGGFETILRFYNIWAENQHVPRDFLLVRYEDIHADPQNELRRALDFMGLQALTKESISEAVAYASFDNMHRMEKEHKFRSSKLRPADPKDKESYKTRKGKVGGFIEHLNEAEINYLNNKMKDKLSPIYKYHSDVRKTPL